jgi:LysM repeat protein
MTDPLGLFDWATGTVQSGDTLWDIAVAWDTSVDELLRYNPQITNRNLIYPGQHINLPPCNSAKCQALRNEQNASNGGTGGSNCGNGNCGFTYTVRAGDTLSGIGAQLGISWKWIHNANWNVIGSNPNFIHPGQRLYIPCGNPGGGGGGSYSPAPGGGGGSYSPAPGGGGYSPAPGGGGGGNSGGGSPSEPEPHPFFKHLMSNIGAQWYSEQQFDKLGISAGYKFFGEISGGSQGPKACANLKVGLEIQSPAFPISGPIKWQFSGTIGGYIKWCLGDQSPTGGIYISGKVKVFIELILAEAGIEGTASYEFGNAKASWSVELYAVTKIPNLWGAPYEHRRSVGVHGEFSIPPVLADLTSFGSF